MYLTDSETDCVEVPDEELFEFLLGFTGLVDAFLSTISTEGWNTLLGYKPDHLKLISTNVCLNTSLGPVYSFDVLRNTAMTVYCLRYRAFFDILFHVAKGAELVHPKAWHAVLSLGEFRDRRWRHCLDFLLENEKVCLLTSPQEQASIELNIGDLKCSGTTLPELVLLAHQGKAFLC